MMSDMTASLKGLKRQDMSNDISIHLNIEGRECHRVPYLDEEL